MAAAEVRLLTATLSETSKTPADVGVTDDGRSAGLLTDVLAGHFAEALSRSEAQPWLQPKQRSFTSTPDYFQAVEEQIRQNTSAADSLLQLQAAVASFLIFTQANLTGPPASLPECPADLHSHQSNDEVPPGATTPTSVLGHDTVSDGDRWASQQLAVDGEEVTGKARLPQYLLLARTLLTAPLGLLFVHSKEDKPIDGDQVSEVLTDLPSWSWWTARVLLINQRLLNRSAATLRSALSMLMPQVLKFFGPDSTLDLGVSRRNLAAAAELECALVEHVYSSPHTALGHLQAAGQALGMQTSVQGAMGMRTAHQVDPKAQLVVSTSHLAQDNGYTSGEDSAALDSTSLGSQAESSELKGLTTDSDVLSAPRMVEGSGGMVERPLGGLEQAVLLGFAQQVKKGTSADELQAWQMAPYVEAVLRQTRSHPVIRASAKLLQARHERTRTRTLERSLMHLQQLAEAPSQPQPPHMTRLRHAFGVLFPLRAALRKELGEQLLSTGLVGAAMGLFEEEELWDSLIICYRLLQKLPQAQQLVQARLQVTPDDASLLCALGDITLDDKHYQKAWDMSKGRSTRAQRSLARSAQRQQHWEEAEGHWEKALGLNPLFPQGWFAMGYCCMKTHHTQRALEAFTRCAQQEPDNGEAWNNIAAIHLQLQHAPEAFSALREAVKYKRDSWQTWANYGQAAAQTGNNLPAARAVQKVMELTQGQRVEVEILAVLVQQMQNRRQEHGMHGSDTPGADHAQQQLEQAVAAALKAASAAPGSTPAVWGLYAQYYRSMGFQVSAKEALLKQIRGLQGSSWQKDPAAFETYATASLQLCRLHVEMVSSGQGTAQNLASARMHLRTTLKQAAQTQAESELYHQMQQLLQEVERLEQRRAETS
ncbi:hypothetical protein WJX82_011005 [Trebouxia sp. C0006]